MTSSAGPGILRPISRGVFFVSLFAYGLLRLWLATLPGYEVDVNQYKEWALGSGLMGFPAIYEVTSADYPPLSLMVFYGVGSAFVASQPPFESGDIPVEIVPTFLIKLPHLVFDLLIGGFDDPLHQSPPPLMLTLAQLLIVHGWEGQRRHAGKHRAERRLERSSRQVSAVPLGHSGVRLADRESHLQERAASVERNHSDVAVHVPALM